MLTIKQRYELMAEAEWFKAAYRGRSLGGEWDVNYAESKLRVYEKPLIIYSTTLKSLTLLWLLLFVTSVKLF